MIRACSGGLSGPDCRLAPLGRKSVLAHVFRRVAEIPGICGTLLVADSEAHDDAVVDHARFHDIPCYRSPADRPAQAMALGVGQSRWDAFVAVRATAPLIDPQLIAAAVARFAEGNCDLVTNQRTRAFPAGQEVEVLASRLLLQRAPFLGHLDPRASLARWFQRLIPPARIAALPADGDWSDVAMNAETPDDLERLRWFVNACGPPAMTWDWKSVAAEMRRLGCGRLDSTDEAAA